MNKVHLCNGLVNELPSGKAAFPIALLCVFFLSFVCPAAAQKLLIEKKMAYLKSGQKPEWVEFARLDPEKGFSKRFSAQENEHEHSLRIRQYDVKQQWNVFLNDRILGNLTVDENDLIIYLPIPAHALQDGENRLRIEPSSPVPDDVMVGEIWLESKPVQKVLSECMLTFQLWDSALRAPLPSSRFS